MANLFGQSSKKSRSEELAGRSSGTFGGRFPAVNTAVTGSTGGKSKWQALRDTSIYQFVHLFNIIRAYKSR